MSRSLMAAALLLSSGCFDLDRVNGPVLGYESDPEACDDGIDNDRDGMVDCRDPGCLGSGLCNLIIVEGARPEPENTFIKCTDRIDNDQDGNFDCGDRNCQAIQELCCVTEFSDLFCSDGVDNDDNGFRDCGDFGCRNNPFVSVCTVESDCDDEEDNDNDGLVDCDDGDCIGIDGCPGPVPEDTIALCSDGIDNDGNGFTDCVDFSCQRAMDNPELVAFCDERLENTAEKCSDGIDNDGNGFTDCRDFACEDFCDPIDPPDPVDEEDGFDECKDGIDNDEDGFPDCADFSCRGSEQERVIDGMTVIANPCQESITPVTDGRSFMTDELRRRSEIQEASDRCSNGIDEDQDGFTDCEDWDCHWNPLLRPGADIALDAGRPPEEGFCQGWRYVVSDPTTAEWRYIAASDARNRPLYCRGY
jgi:hypothetical protein